MSLSSGTRLGPYEILSALGTGGMGEVYRARDPRLGRDVAIKVLPAGLSTDPERLQRFEQEARAAAALNHPNILAVYDIGQHDSAPFIVSELLDGETLRERVTASAVPVRKAVEYAVQIVHGLAAAHEKGIVHRDLKPENIFVTSDGRVKILDFGLAKLTHAEPGPAEAGPYVQDRSVRLQADVSALPTTPPRTTPGLVLGTIGYMSPEQVRGLAADHRSDIFAFGAILYEMLGARRAFSGDTTADTMTAILKEDPPDLPAAERHIPPALTRIVDRCLEKNPAARFQTSSDLAFALEGWSSHSDSAEAMAIRAGRTDLGSNARVAWIAAAGLLTVAVAATAAASWLWLGRTTAEPAKVSFDVQTESAPTPLQLALSPDGSRLVAGVTTPQGFALWVRRLDEVTGQTLAATTGANFPFWSPDGRFIAFFASGKLNKIDVFGGPPQPLCDAPAGHGGTWNRDGLILFAPSAGGPLFTVPAAGGIPIQVTELDKARGDTAHRHPKFLPDDLHFLFLVVSSKPENAGLYVGTLGSKDTRRLVASDAMGVFAPPEHLLFIRSSTLMAQRFDPRRLELEGDPFPLAQDVGINTGNSVAGIAVSDSGVLAYRVGGTVDRLLRWVDRQGKPLGDVGAVGSHGNVTVAPGGDRLAETRFDGSSGDIWIVDLVRGSSSRFTFDPAIDDNPIWSPDGNRIVFASARDGNVRNLYIKNAGGAGQEELLLKTDGSKYPTDWSRDGRYILYTNVEASQDLWVLPLSGDKKPTPFLQTPFAENRARFSPDGRWIAYTSDESGLTQVYVQSFPPSGGKWQISTSAGFEPHWRGDGRELFYTGAGAIWAVDVSAADSNAFKAGVPRKLFEVSFVTNPLGTRFDVAPDGQRFLLNLNPFTLATPPISVVVNWATGLKN